MGHSHHHGPSTERALLVAIVLNALFLGVELAAGLMTNSLALLSDAGHMVSDVGALLLAWMAVRIRNRKPSSSYTFGLRRAPVLGALINGLSLLVIVVFIGIEAFDRIEAPPQLDSPIILWVGIVGLAINLGSAYYLAKSADRSVNTRGAMLHLLSDALGSVAAIISGVAILVWQLSIADLVASIVIGLLILVSSIPLLNDTVKLLLQCAPGHIDLGGVRTIFQRHKKVVSLIDLHLWALDSDDPILSAVIMLNPRDCACANKIADDIRARLLSDFEISHVTIECRFSPSPALRCEHNSADEPITEKP